MNHTMSTANPKTPATEVSSTPTRRTFTAEYKRRILQEADAIFIEELRASGDYDRTAQAFTVLLPVRSVGVMGDEQALCV